MQLRPFQPCLLATALLLAASAIRAESFEYRVLATNKTSTMEKEINEVAEAGFRFHSVMGGETSFGGSQAVVVMYKPSGEQLSGPPRVYRLLATSKTSTMQKEMQQLGDEGFEYKGQTVFASTFGGQEVVVILELDANNPGKRVEYKLLATKKTSTMEDELLEAGQVGFMLKDITVSKTAFGGTEMVCILRRDGSQ
ncbi:MAG: hypothetical protein KDC27_03170 [Acidobacteria bacterium]|nr:hypothetical protein [Acidobacteriota bacterium]